MATITELFSAARRGLAFEAKEYVTGSIKEDFLSGQVLNVRTGNLRSRIQSKLTVTGFEVGTNVIYGVAWELGFTRPEYTIVPKRKKFLRFESRGHVVFAKKVNIPSKKFAARPFIAPAAERSVPVINGMAALHYDRAIALAFPNRTITI